MEEVPFENAMQRLEEIVDLMNQPTTSLDASLALYEEADALMRICESRIRQVEQRVRELAEKRHESSLFEEQAVVR
ncbi:exodeoxyribonuclease VII small chain [Chlamydia pneumoniae TW-183]|uniref:Exodeoxyribonuclease 7 small subunit n=2 Tax=Chlamydia pneumoniae TaxID=83558 RepID=EX7S_CHLPN|nr:exodeoxyribonuclease VII small subunit [Chlamydia pneumoniae]Q9K1Y4.1 RecName: Full=Exodeoxyribonuclease 7 small subunit; AltName: Full=Exodeoxyribonuclease VII small subunit; Short=Exonuclease VII small subunit [Chlamydia pneumoniae]AAF38587.1 exodeoxyribonuclease, small subunit [Chlamydia pneumoniae AR39]AAP99032.1 exodeoxyribonuclease VII small chain [Chlamydia pneumoniae TW-183]ACZ32961.1 exodeoxyribonuclease VII, small subunit [Chlamydia pneumoniae LPCoLN]ETR79852.1 Exodeoxyribonucleas